MRLAHLRLAPLPHVLLLLSLVHFSTAELAVLAAFQNATAFSGAPTRAWVNVTNNGTAPLTDLQITMTCRLDSPGAGMCKDGSVGIAAPAGCSAGPNGAVVCTKTAVQPREVWSVVPQCTVSSSACGNVSLAVTVTATGATTAEATGGPLPIEEPRLMASATSMPTLLPAPGEVFHLRFSVINGAGGSPSESMVLKLILQGMAVISHASFSTSPATPSCVDKTTPGQSHLTCELRSPLPPSENLTLDITVIAGLASYKLGVRADATFNLLVTAANLASFVSLDHRIPADAMTSEFLITGTSPAVNEVLSEGKGVVDGRGRHVLTVDGTGLNAVGNVLWIGPFAANVSWCNAQFTRCTAAVYPSQRLSFDDVDTNQDAVAAPSEISAALRVVNRWHPALVTASYTVDEPALALAQALGFKASHGASRAEWPADGVTPAFFSPIPRIVGGTKHTESGAPSGTIILTPAGGVLQASTSGVFEIKATVVARNVVGLIPTPEIVLNGATALAHPAAHSPQGTVFVFSVTPSGGTTASNATVCVAWPQHFVRYCATKEFTFHRSVSAEDDKAAPAAANAVIIVYIVWIVAVVVLVLVSGTRPVDYETPEERDGKQTEEMAGKVFVKTHPATAHLWFSPFYCEHSGIRHVRVTVMFTGALITLLAAALSVEYWTDSILEAWGCTVILLLPGEFLVLWLCELAFTSSPALQEAWRRMRDGGGDFELVQLAPSARRVSRKISDASFSARMGFSRLMSSRVAADDSDDEFEGYAIGDSVQGLTPDGWRDGQVLRKNAGTSYDVELADGSGIIKEIHAARLRHSPQDVCEVGTPIEGLNDDGWYLGKAASVSAKACTVHWDDGTMSVGVPWAHIRKRHFEDWEIGSQAVGPGGGLCTVRGNVGPSGMVQVEWADGRVEDVHPGLLRQCDHEWHTGQQCEVLHNATLWSLGTVLGSKKVHSRQLYEVELRVSGRIIHHVSAAYLRTPRDQSKWSEGVPVEVLYDQVWCNAVVVAIHPNATFDVEFGSGRQLERVRPMHIRPRGYLAPPKGPSKAEQRRRSTEPVGPDHDVAPSEDGAMALVTDLPVIAVEPSEVAPTPSTAPIPDSFNWGHSDKLETSFLPKVRLPTEDVREKTYVPEDGKEVKLWLLRGYAVNVIVAGCAAIGTLILTIGEPWETIRVVYAAAGLALLSSAIALQPLRISLARYTPPAWGLAPSLLAPSCCGHPDLPTLLLKAPYMDKVPLSAHPKP